MSQFLAIVAAEGEAFSPATQANVEAALADWPGQVRVDSMPGAVLGMSMAPIDRWRARDRQPQVDASSHSAIVTDCRLDNRADLTSALGSEPAVTDGALLLRAFERWGSDAPVHITGDFAGVFWNWKTECVSVFRDALGVKPVFYGYFSNQLVIASEVDLIVKVVRPRFVADDGLIVQHLLWQYASVDRTFWAGIKRLPAGHRLVGRPDRPRVERYWFPEPRDKDWSNASETEVVLSQVFRQSVERRMDPDGPTFAHLSGGLDSSAIVCVANDIRRRGRADQPELRALSERFPGMSCDEGPFIQAVLDWTGLKGISWTDPMTSFPDLEQPALAGPGVKTYRTTGNANDLALTIRGGGRVLLSGQGGDQLGAATEVVDDIIGRQPLRFALETVHQRDLSMAQRRLRLRLMLRLLVPRTIRQTWGSRRYRRRLPEWLQPRCRELAREIARGIYRESDLPFPDAIRRARWVDLTSATLGTTLDLDYRGAASQGVEVRYPFLDQDLVSTMLAIPAELWPPPSANARIHRNALSEMLPPTLQSRRTKAQFSEPMARRLTNRRDDLHRMFHGDEWFSHEFVDRRRAQALLEQCVSGVGAEPDWRAVRGVWGIATLEAWLRSIFGYASSREELAR